MHSGRPHTTPFLAALTVMIFLGSATAQPLWPSPQMAPPSQSRQSVAELTSLLADSIGVRDPMTRDRTLAALRRMGDPASAPLFAQLSQSNDPALRAHGVLGLAELERRRGLDMLAVRRVREPRLRAVIIDEALDNGLIGLAELTEIASYVGLTSDTRLRVGARCVAAGITLDLRPFETLLADNDPLTAMSAAAIIARAAPLHAGAGQVLRTRAGALIAGAAYAAEEFATLVIEHDLQAAAPALAAIDRRGPRPGVNAVVSAARLLCEPDSLGAIESARAALDPALPAAFRRSFALAVLRASLHARFTCPASVFSEMATDPDPLVKKMGAALAALATKGGDRPGRIGELAAALDDSATAWSLQYAQQTHWQEARAIRLSLLAGLSRRPAGAEMSPAMDRLASDAVTALGNDDPRQLDRPLAEAISAGDGPLVRVLLQGVIASDSPRAGALLRQGSFDPRPGGPWPTYDTAALALLAAVRHGEFTADAQQRIERLTAIARGQGGLAPALRAQAAWLALRESGEDRVALTRILSDLPAPAADTPSP